MGFRGCRIAVGGVGVFILFVAFSLTLAAIFTPQWQVAGLEQVNQVRFIGLYQTCAYGSRQGPMSPPQWICTFIPYGHRNQFMFGSAAVSGFHGPVVTGQGSENDHTANGGEGEKFFEVIFPIHLHYFSKFFQGIKIFFFKQKSGNWKNFQTLQIFYQKKFFLIFI